MDKMKPFYGNIESLTEKNSNFRKVIFTGKLQLVLMSLKPGEEIGEETHKADQFFRVEQGTAVFVLNKDEVFIARDGDAVIVPGGSYHNVINKSKTSTLKLYTIYAPPEHPDKETKKTKKEAEATEK
jgi:mannose-6-phosphate isomerase-like protein (cupin superfamily)